MQRWLGDRDLPGMNILTRVACILALNVAAACAADRLVIHEWGTLTSLQDEDGRAIAGINAEDEAVPAFVHEVAPNLIRSRDGIGKGIPGVHPDVTMRLETPVLYIHAPAGFAGRVDVGVKFAGGWLTEFYPDAEVTAPGIDQKAGTVGHITGDGTLRWTGLKIGGDAAGPKTDARVWLSPRRVAADNVTTVGGESERFLFYRGVGKADQILSLRRDSTTGGERAVPNADPAMNPPYWLADIRPDGTAAIQSVSPLGSSRPFQEGDYDTANVAALRDGMKGELIAAGLNQDEADALLNTWADSYFKNPGLRAFYLYPREAVDKLLPLTVTPAADVTRVMVGRIELVTPEERALMGKLSTANLQEAEKEYAGLGRFRAAMALDEERRYPSEELEKFMGTMSVAFYRP